MQAQTLNMICGHIEDDPTIKPVQRVKLLYARITVTVDTCRDCAEVAALKLEAYALP